MCDGEGGSHQHAVNDLAGGSRLRGDKRFAENFPCRLLHARKPLCQLDAARLAASAGVDLRLDDEAFAAQLPCGLHGLLHRESHLSGRRWHAGLLQQRKCLMFVNLQKAHLLEWH